MTRGENVERDQTLMRIEIITVYSRGVEIKQCCFYTEQCLCRTQCKVCNVHIDKEHDDKEKKI